MLGRGGWKDEVDGAIVGAFGVGFIYTFDELYEALVVCNFTV